MANGVLLLFPTQLYETLPSWFKKMPVVLVEHARYFTDFTFHKQKIVLHRATMQMYKKHLEKKGHSVTYIESAESKKLYKILSDSGFHDVHYFDPTDIPLEQELTEQASKYGLALASYESPNFLSPLGWLEDVLDRQEDEHSFRMQHY